MAAFAAAGQDAQGLAARDPGPHRARIVALAETADALEIELERFAGHQSQLAVQVRRDVFGDNLDAWSGDHCMDPEAVPGILLTSRPLRKAAPSLQTLAAALVAEFGGDDFPARAGIKDK